MKSAFTLLETLIAMVIAASLFLTVSNLTRVSLLHSRQNIKTQITLGKQLLAISAYDKARLTGKDTPIPEFFVDPKPASWGITAESNIGYQGVLLP